MAKKKENQETLALVAKLRNSFNNVNNTALSWLGDDKNSSEGQEELNQSRREFFTLPLINTGAGLTFHESTDDENINTVGEFVQSDKKVNTLSKKRKKPQDKLHLNNNNNANLYKVSKDDSRAMLALKRKMRKGKLKELRQDPLSSTEKSKQNHPTAGQFSDEDEEDPKIEKTRKKSIGLLFDNSKKRKKGSV